MTSSLCDSVTYSSTDGEWSDDGTDWSDPDVCIYLLKSKKKARCRVNYDSQRALKRLDHNRRANERARAMRKLETLAQKEQWLDAHNKAETARIAAAKEERSRKRAQIKALKKEDSKPKAVRSIKMSPNGEPAAKKIKVMKTPVETKVYSKENLTGVDGEALLDEETETADPFLAHLDQCNAEFKGKVAPDVTQPLPAPTQLQPNPLATS